MKKIIVTILVLFQIITQANDKLPITEYLAMISSDLNMTFVISDDIDEEFTIMIPNELDNSDYLKILVQVLNKNDLIIEPHGNFFLVSKKEIDDKKHIQFIKLKNVDYSNVKEFFNAFADLKHSYIASNKTIAFNSSNEEYKRIKKLIETVDIIPNQLKLQISIIDTNVNKLKEFGTQFTTNINSTSNFFFNLLAYPFEVKSELSNLQSSQLSAYFKFLNQNDISTLISSPTVTLFDNVETSVSAVKNIPFKSGTSTQKDNVTTTIENISYRDVGLIININPKIYTEHAYLDMNIINETLTTSSDTPTTSKNTIKQRITLHKNKTYVLTGINQKQTIRNISRVPYLSDLPLIDWLFKLEDDEDISSNLTIILQLLDDDYIPTIENVNIKFNAKEKISEHQKRVNKILGLN